MGISIGIDLGTTNSVAAIKNRALPQVIKNKRNEDCTKSVVGWHKGDFIIGSLAVDRMESAPEDTIISVKRLMGRAFNDKNVSEVMKRYLYKIMAPSNGTDDDIRVVIGGKEFSPIDISAKILAQIKKDCEDRLGTTVEYAVITVPAYFTDKQRNATREAAIRAGYKVQRILPEPTAAAYAFGVDNVGAEESKTILVYDLGGGTFDVSILTIAGGMFAEMDIEGDMWLGGDDFDHKIMDYVNEVVAKEFGINPKEDLRFQIALKKHSERAKIELSSTDRAEIIISSLLRDKNGKMIDVEVELTREQFESMIIPSIEKSLHLVKLAIENAGLTKDQIDQVLLVGGSSSIPLVRKYLSEFFGEKVVARVDDPMNCVAQGAAILSNLLGNQIQCSKGHINIGSASECSECGEKLINYEAPCGITGQHYGIHTLGDNFDIIIPKGSPYPSPDKVSRIFETPRDNMRRLKVPVYAGPHQTVVDNELQLIVWLELPEKVKAGTPVQVSLSLNDDAIISQVSVLLMDGSGRQVEVFPDRGDRRGKVEKKLDDLKNKIDALPESEMIAQDELYGKAIEAANKNNLDDAEKIIGKIEDNIALRKDDPWMSNAYFQLRCANAALNNLKWLLTDDQIEEIERLIKALSDAVNNNDETKGVRYTKELEDYLNDKNLSNLIVDYLFISLMRDKSDFDWANKLMNCMDNFKESVMSNNIENARKELDRASNIIDDYLKKTGNGPDLLKGRGTMDMKGTM